MRKMEQINIAFDASVANDLNTQAAQIDGRLFLFAYYEPKQCDGETARYQFITAVVNLYGLLWDCGPFIRGQLLTTREISSGAPEHLIVPYEQSRKNKAITQQFLDLANLVENVRSCYCHNNSKEFFSNERKQEFQKRWLSIHTGCDYDQGPKTEEEWQKALDAILIESSKFTTNLKKCLDYVKNSRDKEYVVKRWINNGILYWYYKNRDLMYNVLLEKYLSKFNRGNLPERVTRSDINNWITQLSMSKEVNVNEIFENWIGRQAQIVLLSGWSSSTPLLPYDVISKMIKSVDSLPPPAAALHNVRQSIELNDF
jgi:hypothetical protein